jgi:hypothetical protein
MEEELDEGNGLRGAEGKKLKLSGFPPAVGAHCIYARMQNPESRRFGVIAQVGSLGQHQTSENIETLRRTRFARLGLVRGSDPKPAEARIYH